MLIKCSGPAILNINKTLTPRELESIRDINPTTFQESDVVKLLYVLENKEFCCYGLESSMAFFCANLGLETEFSGSVGYDEEGDIFQEIMKKSGVKTNLKRDTLPSACRFDLKTAEASDKIFLLQPEREVNLQPFSFKTSEPSILVLTYQNLQNNLMERIKASRLPADQEIIVYLDYNQNFDPETAITLEKLNPHLLIIEERLIHQAALDGYNFFKIMENVKSIKLVRSGLSQTRILTDRGRISVERIHIRAIDTEGSAEAFIAGLLLGHANHKSLKTCVEMGHLYEEEIASIHGLRLSERQISRLNIQLDEYLHYHI